MFYSDFSDYDYEKEANKKTVGASVKLGKPKVALRNFFPESWLFELLHVKEDTLKR